MNKLSSKKSIICAFLICCMFAGCRSETQKTNADISAPKNTTAISETQTPASGNENQSKAENTGPIKRSELNELEKSIKENIAAFPGEWSVYIKDLDNNIAFTVNNKPMYSASLIKIYAMGAVYQSIEQGRITDNDSIHINLKNMITVSSNDSFNTLVLNIGQQYFNDWCSKNNFNDTVCLHGLYPSENGDALETYQGYNTTSVADCGRFLEMIYNGECVCVDDSNKMLELLFEQKIRNKIPAGIPDNADVKIANKTGETDDNSHDCAIVKSKGGNYIICVMSESVGNGWSNADNVKKLSEITYNYFNKK